MKVSLLFSLAALLGAPAISADRTGTVLWDDLNIGMPRAEVVARYPDKRVRLDHGCVADFPEPTYHANKLHSLVLTASMRSEPGSKCGDRVREMLTARHGAPHDTFQSHGLHGAPDYIEHNRWIDKGMEYRLVVDETPGARTWTMSVSPRI